MAWRTGSTLAMAARFMVGSPALFPTLAHAQSCTGDVNASGAVNIDDLLAVINVWGPCANPTSCPADIAPPGGNDQVNIDDLLAVINAWGACPAEEITKTIGPAGGSFVLSNGAQLDIPPGALAQATDVTFLKRAVGAAEADPIALQGETIYEGLPAGLTFGSPALLALPPETPLGPDDSVEIYTRQNAGAWTPAVPQTDPEDDDHEPPFVIDRQGRAATSVNHFSQFKPVKTSTTIINCPGGPGCPDGSSELKLLRVPRPGQPNACACIHQFPFTKTILDASTGLVVWKYLVHEPHSSASEPLVFQGVPNARTPVATWETFGVSLKPLPGVSHIVIHDFGILAPARSVLRNVLNRSQSNYAEFYIAADGTIFQVSDIDHKAAHAACNNQRAIGIELEPLTVDGGFSAATSQAAASLCAYLIRTLHLPFDGTIERLSHPSPVGPPEPHRYLDEASALCTAALGNYAPLNDAARYASIVAHEQIQASRSDPRNLDWSSFLDQVEAALYPAASGNFGAMIDASAADSASDQVPVAELDGGDVAINAIEQSSAFVLPNTEAYFPPNLPGTLSGGDLQLSKVYIGENATVTWSIGGSANLTCGSFYLGRGARLRIQSTSLGATAFIHAERQVQIDGTIDCSGRDDGGGTNFQAVNLTIELEASRIFRVPSLVSRGANSTSILRAGGVGGTVSVNGSGVSGTNPATMILGRAPHARNFTLKYPIRTSSSYSGYGGTSFIVTPGTLSVPGFVTSGGAGAGSAPGTDLPQPGGDGGDILMNLGTTLWDFEELVTCVSGAGGVSASTSVWEFLKINYQQAVICDEIFPAGCNGGRGRISFGSVTGGNGGNGGNAGDITLIGQVSGNLVEIASTNVIVLDGGGGQCPPIGNGLIHRYNGPTGTEVLRVSAIGGSGGPRGGDSATSFPGFNGEQGFNGIVTQNLAAP